MKIHFERTGGFAGLRRHSTIDTDALSPREAEQLAALVEQSGFFDLPGVLPAEPQPDRFQYRITIEDGERSHTVTAAESALPAALLMLLNPR